MSTTHCELCGEAWRTHGYACGDGGGAHSLDRPGSETVGRLRRLRHWAIKSACVAVLTTTVSTALCGAAIWLGLMDIEVAKGTIAGTTFGILLGDLVTTKWKSPNAEVSDAGPPTPELKPKREPGIR